MEKTLSPIFLFLFSVIFILTGCEKNYYDPEDDSNSPGSSDLFGEGVVVSSDFDWSTAKALNISVEVDDQYDGAYYYTVEIFDANPIITPTATILGKGVAKKNKDYISQVTVPLALELVYIRQTSPTGKSIVRISTVSGDHIAVNFGQNDESAIITRSGARQFVAGTVLEGINASVIQTDYPTPATGLTEITSTSSASLQLDASKNYKIPKGETYTGALTFGWGNSESYLYVEGTWNNTSPSIELRGWKIVIQNGGKFTTAQNINKFLLNNNGETKTAALIVANGGEFNRDGNKKIVLHQNYQSGSQIINNGILTASDLDQIIGLYNYSTMNISSKLTANDSRAKIFNSGSFEAKDIEMQGTFQNDGNVIITNQLYSNSSNYSIINNNYFNVSNLDIQGKIENNCKFVVDGETDFRSPSELKISTGAIFQTNTLVAAGNQINIESGAILEVKQKIIFKNGGTSSVSGPSSGEYALARLKEIEIANNSKPQFKGKLEIESSIYPENKGPQSYEVENNTVNFVAEGESTVNIASTDCNLGGNDTDPGGNPANPNFPIIESSGAYTFIFEDNWPFLGDYDMNDLVIDVQPSYSKNSENKVESMIIEATLRAIGASKRLGAAIQLDGVSTTAIQSVSRESAISLTGAVFKVSNGLETGQTNAVIALFDDAHEALGLSESLITNTSKSGQSASLKTIKVTITFTTPVEASAVKITNFNVFIVNGGYSNKRQEVHLPGYQPTNRADTSKFGSEDDNSNNKLYTSKDNLIWGLAVPGPFDYPVEWKKITEAYPDFASWAISVGVSSRGWYRNPRNGFVY